MQQMFFLKREVLLEMYMFCMVVINKQKCCFKRKNCILHQAKKIVLSLLYYFWEKNTVIENMFKVGKKLTKNHVHSCYYAMLQKNSSLCRITAEKYKLI